MPSMLSTSSVLRQPAQPSSTPSTNQESKRPAKSPPLDPMHKRQKTQHSHTYQRNLSMAQSPQNIRIAKANVRPSRMVSHSDSTPSQRQDSRYSHGVLLAPGSSVWPANTAAQLPRRNRTTQSNTPHIAGQNSQRGASNRGGRDGRIRLSTRVSTPKQATVNIRQGVSTRNSIGHAGDTESQYEALMQRKFQWKEDGRIVEANRIQAAVNVGIVVGWTKQDVLDVMQSLETYVRQQVAGLRPGETPMALNDKMIELAGQEEILQFKRYVQETVSARDAKVGNDSVREEDIGFERIRYLRACFGPGRDAQEIGQGLHLHAPYLLTMMQVALNSAMESLLEAHGIDAGSPLDRRIAEALDLQKFKFKAMQYLLVPRVKSSNELFYYLRRSKTGKQRFPTAGNVGAYPGIDRHLRPEEKLAVLTAIGGEDEPHAVDILTKLLSIHGRSPKAKSNSAGTAESEVLLSLTQRALTGLRDEAFLLLDWLCRRQNNSAVLEPEYMHSEGQADGDVAVIDEAEEDVGQNPVDQTNGNEEPGIAGDASAGTLNVIEGSNPKTAEGLKGGRPSLVLTLKLPIRSPKSE